MKTRLLLFVFLALCLILPLSSQGQNPENTPVKEKTVAAGDKGPDKPVRTDPEPASRALMDSLKGVDQAEMDLRFNQMVDDLDRKFHTPAHLMPAGEKDLGMTDKKAEPMG